MTKTKKQAPASAATVRCAIYTRKSTEEGLEQEFNSLDAQRESGEAFVRSQAHEGWTCLPDHYDDGGYTGGNMDRPAVRRLLADIEAGKVDCVVTYKVDRLSRSLLDFAKMMATFEEHGVSFVSVTQQLHTGSSMGRLVLNVLLSFAQFEREIIAERTRDKIAATRRKGKWSGGRPLLGYDVEPRGLRLVVNEAEAAHVRAIFALYVEHESLWPVVEELNRRGWTNKRWRTRKGPERGGAPFTKASLYRLLTNVLYAGQVRYKDEVHPGEQPALVDVALWQKAQVLLRRNGATGGAPVRNRFGALLKGLLQCVPCGCAMTPAHSLKHGRTRYRYYVCTAAQRKGWQQCPSKSVPAAEIEELVVGQIRRIGHDPQLLRDVLDQARRQDEERGAEVRAELAALEKDLAAWHADLQALSGQLRPGEDNAEQLRRLADRQERIARGEARGRELRDQLEAIRRGLPDEAEAAGVLAAFDPLWAALAPAEQARVVRLLVERVAFDGARGKVSITFHAAGLQSLAAEWAQRREGQPA